MSRIADYFVVVGFDHQKQRGGVSTGKILQRFPEKDWTDSPFIDSIEMFCQPQKWRLSSQQQQPSFVVFVLTDIDANRHYCACLSFNEPIAIQPTKHDDEDIDDESITSIDGSTNALCNGSQHHSIMYAPKCLVLVSRFDYKEALKNCLTIIYTVYIDNIDVSMEVIISNILACVDIPPPGGPQIRFSLGAGDRQALQPPSSATIPCTHTTVYNLFEQLGIHSVVNLICAAMTEHKILFHSRSYSRLNDACHALTSLMYPFVYNHIYIPLLPQPLIEVLSTPTPFLMGIHSSLKNEVTDLLDVIVVDLDGGSISIPDCLRVPHFDEPLYSQLITHLCQVIRPQLIQADDAFPSSHSQYKPSPPHFLDKEIRAIFVRTFAQILQGYRSCLTITRIHPKPFITFHKAAFLGQRNLVESDFVVRLLDCMFFISFVQERGLPYRQCDLFDDLYQSTQIIFKEEQRNPDLVIQHIRDLAQQLHLNENPNPQSQVSKIPQPTEGAFTRIHLPPFPILDSHKIQEMIENESIKKEITITRRLSIKGVNVRNVPPGTPISVINDIFGANDMITNSARRLEVMRNCINCIFENKISDARKTFPAVLRALKNKNARLALCQELAFHVSGNKAVLEHQQFDLIVRLMNCALQDDSHLDVNGVAAHMLPLAMAFCRKLCTNVIQFAYTCIQDHAVWSNPQFWEQTFYSDVEHDVKALYMNSNPKQSPEFHNHNNMSRNSIPNSRKSSNTSINIAPSALEIAADQMRRRPQLSSQQIDEFISNENSTVFAQAIHYAHRMVYMKIPLDVGSHKSIKNVGENDTNSVSNLTNSNAYEGSGSNGSNNNDNESGFEEDNHHIHSNPNNSEIGANVIKFISRFVDKVCTDSGVREELIRQLHQMIPGVVAMQMETLEAVYKESKRLPPITKPKITTPNLLVGEELTMAGLRAYLISDGRDEGHCGVPSGTQLLPTEGAIFITNYRIIFKGRPCDPFASESVVVRSFPIATLTKEKRINVQAITSIDQFLQEGLQLRSNTFQLVRVAFDEEVSSDEIESFRKSINRERTPPTIFHLFTFTSQLGMHQTRLLQLQKHKEKNSTFKGMAKKTLLRTAQKAGFKPKNSRKHKYIMDSSGFIPGMAKTMSPSRNMSIDVIVDDKKSIDSDLHSIHSTTTIASSSTPHIIINHPNNDAKTLDKLSEMSYVKDYQRLGLGTVTNYFTSSVSSSKLSRSNTVIESFRISSVNANYSVSKSYPGLIVVPYQISDESIRKFSRCYRHYRFPVITWKHPRTKSVLLRGSCFHGKGVIGMLKGQSSAMTTTGMASSTSSETSANLEQEKLISAIVNLTPIHFLRNYRILETGGSTLSVNSMLNSRELSTVTTPESTRRALSGGTSTAFHRAMNTLRNSGGKSAMGSTMGKQLQKWSNSSIKDRQRTIQSDSPTSSTSGSQPNLNRVALYVFGEKNQIKGIKTESFINCDFIPVDFHEVRQVKASFKKLMRACVPSVVNTDPDQSFHRQFEISEWLTQLQTIMQISGAIVDLIDIQGSSVMVCLEDGWDFVPQIVSVAELCLDPYYRTFDGFRTLIEKEWLAFGHRFSHRSNHTAATLSSGFAPIFLQFLDIVHQIHDQFPLSFEFNQYYLKFIAYHYVSCRFRTFLLDYECERSEVGWISEDIKCNSSSKHDNDDEEEETPLCGSNNKSTINSNSSSHFNYIGTSFWEYSSKIWSKSPLFFNFYYVPIISQEGINNDAAVLRPSFNISSLKLWDYYIGEELAHGPSYDLEVVNMEQQRQEELEATTNDAEKTRRKIINTCYDSIIHAQPNCFTQLLEQYKILEEELNYMPQKWFTIWDKIEIPLNTEIHESIGNQLSRSHSYSTHKRSTIDLLIRGKMAGMNGNCSESSSQLYSKSCHKFEKYNYTTLTQCDHCRHVLWGLVKTGLKCIECGFNCHEKCAELVTKSCQSKRKIGSQQESVNALSNASQRNATHEVLNEVIDEQRHDSSDEKGGTLQHSETFYDNFSAKVTENRTYEGYLYKKGALLKGWKQRWFVLDSTKHQLRYYDSEDDPHCKGFIDLGEVLSVTSTSSNTNTQFFDLKLVRRTYNFMAQSGQTAHEWVEKIQACLQ